MSIKKEYEEIKQLMIKGMIKDRIKLTSRQRRIYEKMTSRKKEESQGRGMILPAFFQYME